MTSSVHDVGAAASFQVGKPRRVEVQGRGFVVLNVGGAHFAARDVCPHQGARLSDGRCKGHVLAAAVGAPLAYHRGRALLQCPWHGWIFDLANGSCLTDPERARIRTYPVHVRGGRVFVDLA